MTVPCTTVPFLSSMVHVSWLSFCKKRTSFIVFYRPPRVSRSCAEAGPRPDLPARPASPIETPTEASCDDRRCALWCVIRGASDASTRRAK